jgi:hypothetical protein
MKYGQIAGSKAINYAIYKCFEYLYEEDQRKFVKKFSEQPHDSDQCMHTFRELILGAYLSSKGFRVMHEYPIEGKTPDWCILDNRSQVVCVVELVNFHIDTITESEIAKQIQAKNIAAYWQDDNSNIRRLYYSIWDKSVKYQSLIEKIGVPYIISAFIDFKVVMDNEEINVCLHSDNSGLFQLYPYVSGVLHFKENDGQYLFKYERNTNTLRDLLGGVFSLRGV